MSTSRTLIRSALVVGALAVGLALVLRGGPDEEPNPDEQETSEAVAEPEPEPEPEPARPRTAERAPAAAPAAQQQAPAAAETAEDKNAPPPLDPQIREHAILMMTPMAKEAMEQRSLEQLRSLREQVRERQRENLMAPNDVEALDVAISCLEGGQEARDEAGDFIEFGAPNSFGDSLRKVCFGDQTEK